MKKFLAVGMVAVFMAIGFLAMAAAETEKRKYTIIGYGSEQYAVVADIERQADEMIKDWGVKKPIKTIVWGFADKTGKMAENEKYASMRANEMKAFLETKTDAKITALSKGQSEDARKVVVAVEFTVVLPSASLPAAQPQAQASIFKVMAYLSAIALVIFLLNSLLDRRSIRKKARKTKVQEIDAKKESPKKSTETTTETKWVEVDGYSVRIEIDYVDGEKRYYSPFTNDSGLQIYGPSESKIVSSLRRCLKPGSKFSEQVKSLLEEEEGPIRPSGCCSK